MADIKDLYRQQPSHNIYMPTNPPSYEESCSNRPFVPAVPAVVPVPKPAAGVSAPISVGLYPSTVTCPHCQTSVTTKIRRISQRSAYIACILLCIFCCCLCSCIPFYMKLFQDVHHYCPQCKSLIGVYKN